MAWSLFEKLVHKRFVRKSNRKVYLAICILLVHKFIQSDTKQHEQSVAELIARLRKIDRNGDLFKKPVFKLELQVYTQLNFSLHVYYEHFASHFLSFLNMLDLNIHEHLSADELKALTQFKSKKKADST